MIGHSNAPSVAYGKILASLTGRTLFKAITPYPLRDIRLHDRRQRFAPQIPKRKVFEACTTIDRQIGINIELPVAATAITIMRAFGRSHRRFELLGLGIFD